LYQGSQRYTKKTKKAGVLNVFPLIPVYYFFLKVQPEVIEVITVT
jgi:hypothetical protein